MEVLSHCDLFVKLLSLLYVIYHRSETFAVITQGHVRLFVYLSIAAERNSLKSSVVNETILYVAVIHLGVVSSDVTNWIASCRPR